MSYAADGMRALILRPGIDLAALLPGIVGLLVFDAVMLALGVRTLRRALA